MTKEIRMAKDDPKKGGASRMAGAKIGQRKALAMGVKAAQGVGPSGSKGPKGAASTPK